MMRISKLADYGTVVMVYLAKHSESLCNARDIAFHTHLTVPTVSKLLKRLTAAGLLFSARGVTGGYRLKRPATEISVSEIIYALDDYKGLTTCSLTPTECALSGVCHVQGNWQLISQAIDSALSSVSLAGLAKPTLSAGDLARVKQLATGVSRG